MITKWLVYILGLIALFNISSSMVYLYQFYTVVNKTFNKTTLEYKIKYPYPDLYLYNSYAWILFTIVIITWIIWFFYKNICKEE